MHYYEGYPMADVVLPVRLMGLLGARTVILTNAAGGVNFSFQPGDLMLITDHITTAVPSPLIGTNLEELGVRFPDMSEVYDKDLREIVRQAARNMGVSPLSRGSMCNSQVRIMRHRRRSECAEHGEQMQ